MRPVKTAFASRVEIANVRDREGAPQWCPPFVSPRHAIPDRKRTKVEVKLKRTEEETFVLCISDGRKQEDRAIRDKHERRLLKDLDKLHARIGARRLVGELKIGEAIGRLKERYPRVARYYDIAFDPDAQTLRSDSGATMRIRKPSTPESEHRKLYRLLGVDEKITSPKTIWSETADHV